MTTFLNALKQQSAIAQLKHGTEKQNAGIQAHALNDLFKTDPIVPLEVRIQRNISKGRLDVFFNRKPEQSIIDDLKEHCFQWNPIDKCWYHKDTFVNRCYLDQRFNAPELVKIDKPPQSTETPAFNLNQSEVPVTPELSATDDSIGSNDESESWKRYKMQVNALLETLNADAADLQLLAVDCLYQQTFKIQ